MFTSTEASPNTAWMAPGPPRFPTDRLTPVCHHRGSQHSTAQHSTAQHSTAQHSTAQHSTAQHSTAQHSTAQHSTAQHSTAQHSTAQHSTAQHSTAQRSAAQHRGVADIRFDTPPKNKVQFAFSPGLVQTDLHRYCKTCYHPVTYT